MANSENTAVNELIARASGGPVSAASPANAQVEDTAARRFGGLQQSTPMHTALPASMPVAAPFEAQRPSFPISYPVVPRAMLGEVAPLFAQPAVPRGDASAAAYGDPACAQSWRPQAAGLDGDGGDDEHMVGTLQLKKRSEVRVVVGRLVLPVVILVIAGIAIGGYVAFGGESGTPRSELVAAMGRQPAAAAAVPAAAADPVPAEPAPAVPAAAPAVPAAAPAVPAAAPTAVATPATPIAEPPIKPTVLVEVRIDSTPSGATVTLVDRGKSLFVGTTPVNAAVDPSREYDLVFSYQNRPPQQEHLNANTKRRVAVTLDRRASAAKPVDSAPRHIDKPERALGEGTLKISSKPPCEIVIDGRPTGLTTPQQSIALPAGNHKVTLINSEKDIKKTVSVQITANATQKVIEDLMK